MACRQAGLARAGDEAHHDVMASRDDAFGGSVDVISMT